MSKQVILVVDENGVKDDDYEPFEIQEGESIDDAVHRFIYEANNNEWGDWKYDTDGIDTTFESSTEEVFEVQAEHNVVSYATFFLKVVEVEYPTADCEAKEGITIQINY